MPDLFMPFPLRMTMRTLLAGWLTVAAALVLALFTAAAEPAYDLVIRGGKIVDGTGNPWFTATSPCEETASPWSATFPPVKVSARSTPRG
jgi:hypothetical protein